MAAVAAVAAAAAAAGEMIAALVYVIADFSIQ